MKRIRALLLFCVATVSFGAQSEASANGICTAYLKPGIVVSQWRMSAENCRFYCEQNGFSKRDPKQSSGSTLSLAQDCIFEGNEKPWSAMPVEFQETSEPSEPSGRFAASAE